MQRYISIQDLSEISGLSVSTLRRRVLDGSLVAAQPGGRRTRLLFPIDILDRLMPTKDQAVTATFTVKTDLSAVAGTQESIPGPKPKWTRSQTHP
jgi:hypothetical protein